MDRIQKSINNYIDINVLMRSIRTVEYKNIVKEYFGMLPKVSCFDMFENCQKLISKIPQKDLQVLFLNEIKKRKSNTSMLHSFPFEIRQMCLSMNLNQRHIDRFFEKLNHSIIL